jgi:elongation factor Ts
LGVETIKVLRERTGAGIMACKTALKASDDNLEKAIDYLRRKGLANASKKSGRATDQGAIGTYIHAGGKVGVLIEVNCETDFVARNEVFQTLLKDLAMQVAGASPAPRYVKQDEIPEAIIAKEREIFVAQAKESKKPEAVIERIADGKLNKFIQEICLLEQPFIKDTKVTIKELIAENISKTGENIKIKRFTRYLLGENEG